MGLTLGKPQRIGERSDLRWGNPNHFRNDGIYVGENPNELGNVPISVGEIPTISGTMGLMLGKPQPKSEQGDLRWGIFITTTNLRFLFLQKAKQEIFEKRKSRLLAGLSYYRL